MQKINGGNENVSIHPPRVGRDRNPRPFPDRPHGFNPPSPCGEGQGYKNGMYPIVGFQSTLPVWGGIAKVHKNSL